jgi:tripartite ATP-independent transporter DctP family solute receptor
MKNKSKTKKLITCMSALVLSASISTSVMADKFNIAVGDGGGSAQQAMGLKFAELLAKNSAGKHTANLFLNGQLGSEQDTVNDASMGTLDFSILASNNVAPFSPTLGLLSLPYVFENLEQADKALKSPIVDELIQNTVRDAGVRIIGWTYSGFRTLSNSKHPVRNLSDLDDIIVRVPKSEIVIDTYKSWGNNPTPMAWSEVFTALQQGVVDAQDTPYITIYSMKFGEVQKYLTNLHYNFLLEPLIVSETVFQDMDKKTQQLVLNAGQEASEYSLQWLQEKESGIKEELVAKYGMQIHDLEDEDLWAKRAQDAVWPKFYDSVGGKPKVNELLRLLGRDEV